MFISGLSLITSLQNGRSPKNPCLQWGQQYGEPSTLSRLEQSFITAMEQSLTQQTLIQDSEKQKAESEALYVQNLNMPHRNYPPMLTHDGLEWIAQYGMDAQGKPLLVGRGPCPSQALTNFDMKWLGIET